jgi:quinol monooxygenase YgiN
MTDHVYWVFEVAVQPDKVEAFKALSREMCDATNANEPGTLAYHWNAGADGTTFHIFEHYKDSAAAMTHLGNFGKHFASRFMPMVKPVRFSVYGKPGDDVKKGLAGLGPVHYASCGGFIR